MSVIRILADDLTGALDTAAAFAGEVPVFIDRPPSKDSRYADALISVVATPARDVPPEELPGLLQPVLGWLKSGDLAFKKVDSLLRGNTFAETAWIARAGRFHSTVFAPAFPAQGRVTINGQQWVLEAGNPTGQRHPVGAPFCDAFGSFGLSTGFDLQSSTSEVDVWIPDVSSDLDLDGVALLAEHHDASTRLWCGSAGLAHALARRKGMAPPRLGNALPWPAGRGLTVLVSASQHPVLRDQWRVLCNASKPPARAERARDSEVIAALDLVRKGANSAWFDLSSEENLSPALAAQLLSAQTAQLVAGLPKPAQLIVVGGDTFLGLCRAAGVDALLAQASVRNGWGCARLQGGVWDGVPCYSRSGAFGGADDLLAMIRLLNGSENSMKGN